MSEYDVFVTVYDLYNEYVEREYKKRNIASIIDGEYSDVYDEYFSDCHSYVMRLLDIFYETETFYNDDILSFYYHLTMMIY